MAKELQPAVTLTDIEVESIAFAFEAGVLRQIVSYRLKGSDGNDHGSKRVGGPPDVVAKPRIESLFTSEKARLLAEENKP